MSFPRKANVILILVLFLSFVACGEVKVPENFKETHSAANIYPDYTDIAIPSNISPLNFLVKGHEEDDCLAALHSGGTMICGEGKGKVTFDIDVWHEFLAKAGNSEVVVRLYVKKDGEWLAYNPFKWFVKEEIDPFVCYRLIPPSYVCYEELRLCQRDLTSFTSRDIYNNIDNAKGINQCINCHSFQNYGTDRMQFHVRGKGGGTLVYDHGRISKVNLKRGDCISSGVYPSWHPKKNLIAYSTNSTMQHFHAVGQQKVEVQDSKSDLILYDVENDKVLNISNKPFDLEVFPSWSPDGKWLYYSSATVADTAASYTVEHYTEIRYNICRRSFNENTLTFGEEEVVLNAANDSLSAILPRVSPDGRYILYTAAPYGVFHIWHEEADLYLYDLSSKTHHSLSAANSSRAESFHNWSSNGRWITFTSRRNDGNYTSLFFSYIDKNGKSSKAFQLPQENPEHDILSTVGYNVPEFTKEKIKTQVKDFRNVLKQ